MANLKQEKRPIRVLFIAAEADPFVKVGGLGDVAGSLPGAILDASELVESPARVDIRLVIPFYPHLKEKLNGIQAIGKFPLKSGTEDQVVTVYETNHGNVKVYLLDGDPVRQVPEVYSNMAALDAEKFIFFSLASVLLPEFLDWKADIIHVNDWHTAIAAYSLKAMEHFRDPAVKTVLSIHNLPYLGQGCQPCMQAYDVPPYPFGLLPSWAQQLPLPLGLSTADRIIPVSPGYAQEIQTPEFGCGLERLLQSRSKHITGIINGLDQSQWNPETDPLIAKTFTQKSIDQKWLNKQVLLESHGMDVHQDIPLLVVVSRMDYQKGMDLVVGGLQQILDFPWQAIILGSGDAAIEEGCVQFSEQHPNRVRVITGFHASLAHQLYAGGDIFLMPSRYEPCGISQMISMRYGTIPVARATGGLKDTIIPSRPGKPGTGYLFDQSTPDAFAQAVQFSLQDYSDSFLWAEIQRNAMNTDFSWQSSALKYIQQYTDLVRLK
jgi:starch synthase